VEKQRMEGLARGMGLANVRFLPMVPQEEYPSVLYASDVCLATLRAQVKTPVVPSKILSIMAAGKPVVATMDPEGDAPRLVREAECGYPLPAGDSRALAEAVLRLYNDASLRRRLGNLGRVYAEAHLSLRQAAERYSVLLAKLVEKPMSSADQTAQRL
jgi:glycosyltransferase involved in cell wall biosynthesis